MYVRGSHPCACVRARAHAIPHSRVRRARAQSALAEAAVAAGVSGVVACDVQSDFLKLTAEFEKVISRNRK